METLITDPWFYAVSVPAVIFVGMAKGGFGGAMALLGVPMMALVMPPFQAAAIMLPILVVMDMVSLWSWRGFYDKTTLKLMLPGAVAGIGFGWLIASWVTSEMVKLIVGIVALLFVARYLWTLYQKSTQAKPHRTIPALFWGATAGFTSFVSHAGGPPYQIYTLPLKQDPKIFTGTSVIMFSVINAVKLIPYFALGQFDSTNLTASAVLMPLAPAATFAGAWLVKKMRPDIFYWMMYIMLTIVGFKLVWDGSAAFG